MELKEAIFTRRSVRKFKNEAVPREDILEILEYAIQSPSAGNMQMWNFLVITNKLLIDNMGDTIKRRILELTKGKDEGEIKSTILSATLFTGAPVVIAVTTEPYRGKPDQLLIQAGFQDEEIGKLRMRPDLQSIGSVIQTLLLAAWEKGYGTCWMTGPNIARIDLEKLLNIQEPASLAAMVALGKPEIVPKSRGRKAIQEVVRFIQ